MASRFRNDGKANSKLKKASWTPNVHEIFIDLCLEQTLNGNKPGTHFTKEGWRNILESFHRKTGLRYDRMQLKNRWDNTKKEWKTWCKLIGTSSMKWDPNSRKFGASEEDWTNYIEKNPEAAPFQLKEPLLSDKLYTIFDGIAVTGETESPTQQRKHNDSSTTSLKKPKLLDPAKPDRVFDAFESRSVMTVQSSAATKQGYSIGECIDCLDEMEEVEQGSELYLFALDIFLKKEYREIFLNLKKPSVRITWLQRLQSAGSTFPLVIG